MEEHLGSIEVYSNANGTTFRLCFNKSDKTEYGCHSLSAAVLAGGQSKRLGQNKALLRVGGKPMIKRVVERVLTQVPEVMIISNQPATYSFLGLPVYPDDIPGCGPLGGIYTALLHSKYQYCLVIACDLPFLSKPLLQFLCENCAPYDVLAFESDSGVEPLCAVYSKRCLSVIEKQIKAGQYKVSDFYDKVTTRLVRFEPKQDFYDTKSFININTKKDLTNVLQLMKDSSQQHKANKEKNSVRDHETSNH